jgi:ribosomal protein S27AE
MTNTTPIQDKKEKCPNCKKGIVSWVDFSNVFSCSHCFYTRTKDTTPIQETERKVPCWLCKGSGIGEKGEDITGDGWMTPDTDCGFCKGTGMIVVGSKEHKDYQKYMKLR